MKHQFNPRAMKVRAQMARRVLKRTRTLTRPTEAHAMMRANAAHLLERYRQTHNPADLEAYVAWVGEGNLIDGEIDDETALDADRITLRRGCARCGRRLPDEEFIEWAQEKDGRQLALRHFWCSGCRAAFGRLSWQDILKEDAFVMQDRRAGTDRDMRRGAKRIRRIAQDE